MYCLVLPLTLIDFVPEVMVGFLPQPAELARLVSILAGDVGSMAFVHVSVLNRELGLEG
jgi:hypothetical protein